jgi:hypothetical protein
MQTLWDIFSRHRSSFWWGCFVGIVVLAAVVRLWKLGSIPVAPYWEEAALGYDAYSLLKTGKDHHGHTLPLVAFESFGDWKPSLYFYAAVPSIAIFGLSTFAVRLPSALAGVAIVIGVGWLARIAWEEKHRVLEAFDHDEHELRYPGGEWAQLVGMALTSISPWAIQFSRGAWEANVATALVLWSVIGGLELIRRDLPNLPHHQLRPRTVFWLSLFMNVGFGLALYTYHATRVIAPLVGSLLALVWVGYQHTKNRTTLAGDLWKNIRKNWFAFVAAWLIGTAIGLPLALNITSPQLTQRLNETSIFGVSDWVTQSNIYRERQEFSLVSRALYHRVWFLTKEVATNFLAHWRIDYLFFTGDINPRHSTPQFGLLYPFDIVFLLIGVGWCLTSRVSIRWFLLGWIVLATLPAALTTAVPHALRTLPAAPAYLAVLTLGVCLSGRFLIRHAARLHPVIAQGIIPCLIGLYVLGFGAYWLTYTSIFPIVSAASWQDGYQPMIAALEPHLSSGQPIFITREQGRPAMYFWFFTKTDPRRVQVANETTPKDQGEFLAFEQVSFIDRLDQVQSGIVASSPEFFARLEREKAARQLSRIQNAAGDTVWVISQVP